MNFYTNGTWKGSDRVPPELNRLHDLSGWIKIFLTRLKNIGKTYRKFLANDRELVGQEKANLAYKINELVGAFFLLRRYVTEENPSQFSSLPNKYHYYFTVKIVAGRWDGNGKLAPTGAYSNDSFLEWYNSVMMKKTREIFQLYAKAAEDGVFTLSERKEIIFFIEDMINEMLLMQSALMSSGIKN